MHQQKPSLRHRRHRRSSAPRLRHRHISTTVAATSSSPTKSISSTSSRSLGVTKTPSNNISTKASPQGLKATLLRRSITSPNLPFSIPSSSFSTASSHQILPNPLHTSSQIRTLFPDDYDSNIGFNPNDSKHLNPPQRLGIEPGVWGLRGVSSPADFDTLYIDKVHQIEARAHRLLTNPTTIGSLQHIDDISKLLCDIADISEAIRVNHKVTQWTRKANSVHQNVQDLLGSWSSSPIVLLTLYNIIRTKEIWDTLPLEGRRVVLDLIGRMNMNTIINGEDYELIPPRIYESEEAFSYLEEKDINWIAIPSAVAETLSAGDKRVLSRYSTSFKFKPVRPSFLHPSPPEEGEDGDKSAPLSSLKSFLPKSLQQSRNTLQHSPDSISLPIAFRNSPSLVQTLLKSVEHHKLRKLLYKFRDLSTQSRLDQLHNLIKYRHIFGLCQGHLSYSHSINSSHLSKTPNVPIKVITTFLDNLTQQRLKEYNIMAKVLTKLHSHYETMVSDEMSQKYGKGLSTDLLKASLSIPNLQNELQSQTQSTHPDSTTQQGLQEENANTPTNTKSTANHTPHRLHMSDIPYVIQSIRSATNSSVERELPNYLQLDAVLQGIGLICNVMDVQLEAHMIRDGEGWGQATGVDVMGTYQSALFSANRVMSTYKALPNRTDLIGVPAAAQGALGKDSKTYVTNATYHHAVHQLKQPQTWCSISDIDLPSNHHLIAGTAFKLHFVDKSSQELLGVLYVDPYDSPNKAGGGAQYVITCGRMAHEFTDQPATHPYINHPSSVDHTPSQQHPSASSSSSSTSPFGQSARHPSQLAPHFDNAGNRIVPTTQFQFETPTTFLTTSIDVKPPSISTTPSSTYSNCSSKPQIKLPLFTYDHLKLLLHEVGHSFHTIKSRTQFQHFSGSRCEMDFVEAPSTLFEILAQDPKFIKLFAKHHITGAPLPDHLYDAISIQQTLFPIHKVTQTGLMSLLDLRLFGVPSPITSPDDVVNPFRATSQLAKIVQTASLNSDEHPQSLLGATEEPSSKSPSHLHSARSGSKHIDDIMLDILTPAESSSTDPKAIHNNPTTSGQTPNSRHPLNLDNFRPESVLQTLYKDRGFDLMSTGEDGEGPPDSARVMQDILDSYSPTHSTPPQTILQAHAIYRRYGNIDIHEDGPGVMFGDEALFAQLRQAPTTPAGSDVASPDSLRKHFTMHALTENTPSFIYPHSEHTHLAHYGGFYFSYLYCRAFATIVKKRVFDPLFDESQRIGANSKLNSAATSSAQDDAPRVSFSNIAELNDYCGGMDQRKAYMDKLQAQGLTSSMFDLILPTTRNGVDFRQKVLQPGGSQSGLDILADLLLSQDDRIKIARELKAQKHAQSGKKEDDDDLSVELNELSTQKYDWPDEIFATPFARTGFNGNGNANASLPSNPSEIAYNQIGVLSDEFLGQEQLDHRENEKAQWQQYLSSLPPSAQSSLPNFPPHSSDLSLIYSTLTNFQHHVGWKTHSQLPYEDDGEEEAGQQNSTDGAKSSPAQPVVAHDGANRTYNYFDPMMLGLTPLQQHVLHLSFETLEKESIEQSENGLKHILQAIDI